jgi:transposase
LKLNYPADYQPADKCSCGSETAVFDYVPDSVLGLSIQGACCIHDFMYSQGTKQWDKERADRIFLENMLALILAGTKWGWLLWMRKHRAYMYYTAVVKFGGPSFWEGKDDKKPKSKVA